MIKEIFNNLGELAGSDKENKDKKAAEILLKVKNMMTDRHVVNSSLKICWKNGGQTVFLLSLRTLTLLVMILKNRS
jgi:hypothetical protein